MGGRKFVENEHASPEPAASTPPISEPTPTTEPVLRRAIEESDASWQRATAGEAS